MTLSRLGGCLPYINARCTLCWLRRLGWSRFLIHVIPADQGTLSPGEGYGGRGRALLDGLWSSRDFKLFET
jgi:hypothetical protein